MITRQDRKTARQIAAPERRARRERQEREFVEIHHRVANSLQLAVDLLSFERGRAGDAQAALNAAGARLIAVAELHRYLYAHRHGETVDLREFLEGLGARMELSTGLSCSVDVVSLELSADVAQHLAIAINELAINAKKHAYRDEVGALHVEGVRVDDELRLTISDDGPGFGDDFDPAQRPGVGMSIVRALVRQIGASLSSAPGKGARFVISLPLASEAPRSRSFAQRTA